MIGTVVMGALAGLVASLAVGATAAGAEADGLAGAAPIAALRAEMEEDPGAPVRGNPGGDVAVVEFLDYNCAPCRAAQEAVERLLAEDPGVRLVVRERPTEGPASEAAARAALAVRAQGTEAFRLLHGMMLGLDGPADERPAVVLAQVLGLDDALLLRDMAAPAIEEHLAASRRLAAALGVEEAPAFVVGDRLLQGAVTLDELRAAVAAAREAAAP